MDHRIQLPYPAAMIKDAPEIPVDRHLTEGEEEQLYDYYAVHDGPAPSG